MQRIKAKELHEMLAMYAGAPTGFPRIADLDLARAVEERTVREILDGLPEPLVGTTLEMSYYRAALTDTARRIRGAFLVEHRPKPTPEELLEFLRSCYRHHQWFDTWPQIEKAARQHFGLEATDD